MKIEGGSFGLQVGGAGSDVVILVMNKSGMEKLQRVLTDEQKSQWKQMTGKPLRGTIQMMPPPFGPPPRFGPPGGGPAGGGGPRGGAFLRRPDASLEARG